MVLIALAIVFGGLGALSLANSDSGGNGDSPAASGSPNVAPPSGTANTPAGSAKVPASTAGLPTSAGLPTTSAAGANPGESSSASGAGGIGGGTAADKSVAVRVFNNSNIAGLAAQTADELKADGWNIAETGNYSEGVIPKTTVYYGNSASEKQAAEAVASVIGASAEKRFAGIEKSSPGVIVIVTQ